jgi:hypothetical protein
MSRIIWEDINAQSEDLTGEPFPGGVCLDAVIPGAGFEYSLMVYRNHRGIGFIWIISANHEDELQDYFVAQSSKIGEGLAYPTPTDAVTACERYFAREIVKGGGA